MNMPKKMIVYVLLCVCMLCVNGVVAKAETFEDYTYSLINYDDVSGEYTEVQIDKYNGTDAEVAIPSSIDGKKVTTIGDYAFQGCNELTNVVIPEGVKIINRQAFAQCGNLINVNLPNTLTSIGIRAFFNTWTAGNKLEFLTIPNGVVSIGDKAFSTDTMIYCSDEIAGFDSMQNYLCITPTNKTVQSQAGKNITAIFDLEKLILTYEGTGELYSDYVIADKIKAHIREVEFNVSNFKYIKAEMYNGCAHLIKVTLCDGVTSIGASAFGECNSLTSITLSAEMTSIGSNAFSGCSSLKSISLPDGITNIGSSAFSDCSSLTNITLPQNVTSIESSTFKNCSNLASVIIPISVIEIETNAFYHSENVTIYGAKNSYAEEYANQYDIPFVEHTHEATETDEAVSPACTETGLTEGSHCSVCGGIIVAQTVVDAKGHTPVTDPEVKATCTEDGKTEGSHCSVCNEILTEQTVTKATGHNWDEGTLTKQPTWKDNGIITYTCKNCGLTKEIQTATIEAKIEDSINKQIEDKTKAAEEKLSTIETAKMQAEEKASEAETAKAEAEEKASTAETKAVQAEQRNAELEQKLIKASFPEKLKAKYKKKSISLSWKKPADAEVDGYKVYMSTKKNKGYKQVADVAVVKAVLKKGLKLKKTYYIKVRGYKVVDGKYIYTKYSSVAKVKTK